MSSLDPKTLSNLARDNRYLQVLEHILSKNAELIKTEAKKG